jgi:hypothetical protein
MVPGEDYRTYFRRLTGFRDIEFALSAARYELDEDGHPRVPEHRRP